jgi:hypothetical protein
MHAEGILQKSLLGAFEVMHADRVASLLGSVSALLAGGRLVLMDLARSYPGAIRVRAPLKRLDRLLSNPHLANERRSLYEAMSRWLISIRRPVIAIDWSPLDARERYQLLRASIAFDGRALTVFEEVHPTGKLGNPKVERDFLKTLAGIIPATAKPIILSDAGFRTPWFEAVTALGWDYVGRLRGKNTNFRFAKQKCWQKLTAVLKGAHRKAECLGTIELTKWAPWRCRLIRSRLPHKGRKLLTKSGVPSRASRSRKAQRRASEPCLLVSSLTGSAAQVVRCYRQRMQIEESFRDLKCARYGAGFDLSQSRDPSRIATLLLIHALATFVAQLIARSVPDRTLTIVLGGVLGKRRHYSRVWLGWQLLRRHWLPVPPLDFLMDQLRSTRPFALV